MVKLKEIFREKIFTLLDLCSETKSGEIESSTITSPVGTFHRKKGYARTISTLTYEIIDRDNSIGRYCSSEFLKDDIDKIIEELFKRDESDKSKIIDEIIANKIDEWRTPYSFFIPFVVENLIVDQEIKMGEVTFIPYDKSTYLSLFQSKWLPTEKIKWERLSIKDYVENTKFKFCIAYTTIHAHDNTKAIEIAEEITEEALNIIRIMTYRYHNFGIKGNYFQPTSLEGNVLNINKKILHGIYSWTTNPIPYILKKEQFELFVKSNLKAIPNILKTPPDNRTPFQNKLLHAIKWYGEVIKYQDRSENIIKAFTAFETLLLSGGFEEKRRTLCERISFIYTPNKESRIKVLNIVNGVYTARNNLVHVGSAEISELDYNTLIRILRGVIMIISSIIDEYPNLDDLIKEIEDKKYVGVLKFQEGWDLKK